MQIQQQKTFDVFISYSHSDYVDEKKNIIPNNEVSKIKGALYDAGISFWFDEKGIIPGEDYAAKILKHIKVCKIFVYLSSKSASASDWTPKEIACALMYKKHIIPVLLDDSPFNESVMFRIVDLDMINYYLDPQREIEKLINAIKIYLAEDEAESLRKGAEEQKRQELAEKQRLYIEEERIRKERIEQLESKIAAENSRLIEFKKNVLKKEMELESAKVDLSDCEARIQELQEELKCIGSPINQIANNDPIITIAVGPIKFDMIRVDGLCSSFYIGETTVTQALWELVMANNPSTFKGPERPVETISWLECKEFIDKLNSMTGMNFRLPSDAEWDFAAKGGNKGIGYEFSGSNDIDEVAWYDKNACDGVDPNSSDYGTHNVKSKKPNELGIYDMSGNVWEWCEDLYDASDTLRVLRGGSWFNYARDCSVSNRNNFDLPTNRNNFLGMRLVL